MLVHAAYGSVEAAGLQSDYPNQFEAAPLARWGNRLARSGKPSLRCPETMFESANTRWT